MSEPMAEPSGTGEDAGDEVSIVINASPERLYEIVSDITQMGRLSPECTGGRWIRGASGPAVGARFVGFNRRGWVRWFTFNEVVEADPGRSFAFRTKDSNVVWAYRFAAEGDATRVTESRTAGERPALARFFTKLLLGGGEHEQELREGMRATLKRLEAAAAPEP